MFRWISDNKEWLFSGAFIALVSLMIGLVQFIRRKLQQREITILRSNASRIRDGVLVAEKEWNQERESMISDFDRAASVLSGERDHALTFLPEVFAVFGPDSFPARDLSEAADLLQEASRKRSLLDFDTVSDFWSAGDRALSKFKEALDRLLEHYQKPWYRRWFRKGRIERE